MDEPEDLSKKNLRPAVKPGEPIEVDEEGPCTYIVTEYGEMVHLKWRRGALADDFSADAGSGDHDSIGTYVSRTGTQNGDKVDRTSGDDAGSKSGDDGGSKSGDDAGSKSGDDLATAEHFVLNMSKSRPLILFHMPEIYG